MKLHDIVIGRRGDSLTGRVLDREFPVTSVFGPIKVKTRDIALIHFKNPPQFQQDEICLKNGDKLSGTIKKQSVHFKPTQGPALNIPRDSIHTLMINQKWNTRGKMLRSE
jgi:hypothetical protein